MNNKLAILAPVVGVLLLSACGSVYAGALGSRGTATTVETTASAVYEITPGSDGSTMATSFVSGQTRR